VILVTGCLAPAAPATDAKQQEIEGLRRRLEELEKTIASPPTRKKQSN